MPRPTNEFQTIRSEGGLLPPDLLRRVVDPAGKVSGVEPTAHGLPAGERLNEAITQSWNRLRRHWAEFRAASKNLPEDDATTGLTNDKWSLPLLRELGFGFLTTTAGPTIDGKIYAISRFAGNTAIHLVGCGVSLDRRESFLALTPQISSDGAHFTFAEFAGNERKTSGSYYTPDCLVQCLLDSALDPVVQERLADAERLAKMNWTSVEKETKSDPAKRSYVFRYLNKHLEDWLAIVDWGGFQNFCFQLSVFCFSRDLLRLCAGTCYGWNPHKTPGPLYLLRCAGCAGGYAPILPLTTEVKSRAYPLIPWSAACLRSGKS